MDQTMTETLPATTIPEPMLTHDDCLTSIVTHFLLGRVSMDEVCQFCVLARSASQARDGQRRCMTGPRSASLVTLITSAATVTG